MKKIILSLLVVSTLLISCKKKDVEQLQASNSPVFLMDGELDGEYVSYVAGDNGMVMNSGVEIRNGVEYSFSNFTDGNTSIKIGSFDGNIAVPDLIKNYEQGETYSFAQEPAQALAYLSPSLMTNGYKVENVNWYADGVLLNDGADNVSLTKPGVYFIRGEFFFPGGIIKNIVNRMYLGFENDVDFSVRHLVTDPNALILWIEGATNQVDSIQWYIDGQYEATGATCKKDIGANIKDVAALVHFSNGAVQQKKILVDGSHQGHYVEDFNIFKAPDQDLKWDNTFGFELEKDGESYSSFDVSNNKGTIVVKGVSPYKHPVTGVDMLRLETEIQTKLKCIATGEVIQSKLNAVLGLPVPN